MGLVAAPAHAYTSKGVGVVTALRGEAAVAHAPDVATREGRPPQEPLRFREDVFFRDVIDTQRDSTAKLLLRGRSTFTIRELSRVELREGVVPADPTRTRSIVNLLTGAFRAIVQRDLRPQDELEIQTPNAISAVRGSDISVLTGLPAQLPPDQLREALDLLPPGTPPPGPDERVTLFWIREAVGEILNPLAPGRPSVPMANNVLVAVIGARPPIVALAVPDLVARIAARFALPDVVGPLGSHLARVVSAAQGQAAAQVPTGAAAFQPGFAAALVERAVNSIQAALTRDIDVAGSFTGTGVALGGGTGQAFLTAMLSRIGTTLFSTADSAASPSFGLGGGTATLSGSFSGTARLLSAVPGSVHISGIFSQGPGTIRFDLSGPVFLLGNRFGGSASGTYTCIAGPCTPSGSLTLIFK